MSAGLFRPEEFRDNCGFGLIAHMAGDASHRLLLTAIESLTCMTHRGGIAADGKTGDGCGLLMQMPDQFMRTVAQECFGTALGDNYGVGQVFLSNDPDRAAAARSATEKALSDQGLRVLGWRVVPTDSSVCGSIALASLPVIEQVFVDASGASAEDLSTKLFVARRKAEIATADDDEFYICSFFRAYYRLQGTGDAGGFAALLPRPG